MDVLFPAKKQKKKDESEDVSRERINQKYKVFNYPDDENLWDFICQIGLIRHTNYYATKIFTKENKQKEDKSLDKINESMEMPKVHLVQEKVNGDISIESILEIDQKACAS